ncbi:MAG: hypothetical protein P1V36_12965 [Planctomycetota bacterium]|nr:hypothetical protein [Planctomycetota bacterium]
MRAASLILLASLLLPGCGSFAGPTDRQMSYAAVQQMNPGVEGEWILSEYPFARNIVRRGDGTLCSMGYWVDDPYGKSRPLMLHFDERGVLSRKQYGGPHVRPPERSENIGFGG